MLSQVDVSQAQTPGVAYALIAAAIVAALAPVALAVVNNRRKPPEEPAGKHAEPPPPALPSAVAAQTDLAERYFTGLERRAETAERLLRETQERLDDLVRRHADERLEWQRKLDAAQAELDRMKAQIERLTWYKQDGGGR